MTEREQAILDCKYAKSIGQSMLNFHIGMWLLDATVPDDDEKEYQLAIIEIKSKLGTEECLLN